MDGRTRNELKVTAGGKDSMQNTVQRMERGAKEGRYVQRNTHYTKYDTEYKVYNTKYKSIV